MVSTNESISLLRPALLVLLILAVLKLFGAFFGLRLLLGTPSVPGGSPFARLLAEHRVSVGTILLLAYGFQFIFCLVLRRGLRQIRPWARIGAYIYSVFHVAGVFAAPVLGAVSLLNGVLGAIALYSVLRADRAGTFREVAVV